MLDAVLLSPPLPAVIDILILIGVAALAKLLASWLRGRTHDSLDYAACFVSVTAILCSLLHGIAWLGIPHLFLIVRVVGWVLAVIGIVACYQFLPMALDKTLLATLWYRQQSLYVRLATILAVVTLAGYLAATLGPVTDIDSLDYHLGVPLDWLLHGAAYPRPDWLHARLVGLGEMIDMLGLAVGTDSLGAIFQLSALVLAAVAVDSLAEGTDSKVLGVLLVVGCPVALSLVPIQKPELFPAAATAIALIMIVKRWEHLDLSTMALAFGCVAFAMGCKYSFLLTGPIVLVVGLVAAHKSRRLPTAMIVVAVALFILPIPVWAQNLIFYRDPISPLLERFKPAGDARVIAFAQTLRGWPDEVTVRRVLLLPWQLTATVSLSDLSSILGLGTLAFILAIQNVRARVIVLSAAVATLLTLTLCQLTPRFFLEPYLWFAAAAVGAPDSRFKSILKAGLLAQGGLVAVLALWLGIRLFPGALTPNLRDYTTKVAADGYEAAYWLNAVLPANVVVLTTLRQHALLRRPFIVLDNEYTSTHPQELSKKSLLKLLDNNPPTAAVLEYPFSTSDFPSLAGCLGSRLYGPATFEARTHNPFRRGDYTLQVVQLKLEAPSCRNGE